MAIETSYKCSRCKQYYNLNDVNDGDTMHVFMEASLVWITNVETETPIDKSKDSKKTNLCHACTGSLLQWYQDNDIQDGD